MQFDTQSLWIYLHFPSLQLDLIQKNGAQAESKDAVKIPRAIYQSTSNQLVQVNQAAFDRGIRVGMGLAKASLLFSDLQLHEYNADVEENNIQQLAQQLYLITSDISLAPPAGIVLRVQNMLHLYGKLSNYWRVLSYCLDQHGFHYHAASAYSIQAAKLIALHGKTLITEDRKTIQQALINCQLSISDVDAKDVEKLARIGIRTVGEMQRLPAHDIANRVNRFSMQIINELRGHSPARVRFFQPSTEFHDFVELLYEIENTEKLLPIIRRSLSKLEQFLYVRNARCLQILVDLFQREHGSLKLKFDSALPIYRTQDWLEIIALRLERTSIESSIHGIELHCLRYEITEIANDDLFAAKSHKVEGLSLISRLISKLGEEKVRQLSYRDDFRPEKNSVATTIGKNSCNNHSSVHQDRPGILLNQPQLLQQAVTVIKGPERIVGGWWDNQEVTRDYYVGQGDDGQQIWIYKTPDNQWYLHGFFI